MTDPIYLGNKVAVVTRLEEITLVVDGIAGGNAAVTLREEGGGNRRKEAREVEVRRLQNVSRMPDRE